jgi:hypothetical protein
MEWGFGLFTVPAPDSSGFSIQTGAREPPRREASLFRPRRGVRGGAPAARRRLYSAGASDQNPADRRLRRTCAWHGWCPACRCTRDRRCSSIRRSVRRSFTPEWSEMHRGHLDPSVATMPLPAQAAARVTAANRKLVDGARARGLPVIHVVTSYHDVREISSNPWWRQVAGTDATRANVLNHQCREVKGCR